MVTHSHCPKVHLETGVYMSQRHANKNVQWSFNVLRHFTQIVLLSNRFKPRSECFLPWYQMLVSFSNIFIVKPPWLWSPPFSNSFLLLETVKAEKHLGSPCYGFSWKILPQTCLSIGLLTITSLSWIGRCHAPVLDSPEFIGMECLSCLALDNGFQKHAV